MQYYTTIEQSKKLLELGLNPDSADMFYNEEPDECYPKDIVDTKYPMVIREGQKHYLKEYGVPCWSLGALWEAMPKEGVKPFTDSNPFVGYGNGLYRCVYLNADWESSHQTIGYTPVEAAYNMVCWLLKNGYLTKE